MLLVKTINASAKNECVAAASHPNIINVKKIEKLAIEDQDMILMAALIAFQLQPASPQINPTIIFLAAITEVEVHGPDKGIFHNFSLIDRTLFTALKHLNILEDVQVFLLGQLGLNSNNMRPFSIRDGGGVTLHLETSPTIFTISHFSYDERASLFLDVIGRPRQNEIKHQSAQEKPSQKYPTFPEHLLLAIGSDIPFRAALFNRFNTTDLMEIRSALQPLFNEVRQVAKPPIGLLSQLILGEDAILQETIQLIRQGISIKSIAEILDVQESTLHQKLDDYKKEHGPIEGRKRNLSTLYSEERKRATVQEFILLRRRGVKRIEAARILGVKYTTLRKWLRKYKPDYGLTIER